MYADDYTFKVWFIGSGSKHQILLIPLLFRTRIERTCTFVLSRINNSQ